MRRRGSCSRRRHASTRRLYHFDYALDCLTGAHNLEEQEDAIARYEQHVETCAIGDEALSTLGVVQMELVFFAEIDLHLWTILPS